MKEIDIQPDKQEAGDKTTKKTKEPTANNKRSFSKKAIILVILALIVLVGVRLNSQNKNNSSGQSNSGNEVSSNELKDETTGWNYKKIRESNQVRTLSGAYKGKTNGFLLYERTESTKPSTLTLPSACNTFSQDDLLHHDGGMAIIKNILKDNGVQYSTMAELSEQFTSKNIAASIVNIEGSDVLRVEDPGKGLTQSCKTDTDKIENNLDFKVTYITLSKTGEEIFVALVDPYIANNSNVLDDEATAKASNLFTEEDLKTQVAYILTHN